MSSLDSAAASFTSNIDDAILFEPVTAPPRALAASADEQQARRAREGVAVLRTRLSGPIWNPAVLERVFWLDPYAIEILFDDAERSIPGTRLEVQLDGSTPRAILARVRARLSRLESRGISVEVRRARAAA